MDETYHQHMHESMRAYTEARKEIETRCDIPHSARTHLAGGHRCPTIPPLPMTQRGHSILRNTQNPDARLASSRHAGRSRARAEAVGMEAPTHDLDAPEHPHRHECGPMPPTRRHETCVSFMQ